MPKVPDYNLKPLRSLYSPGPGKATLKQKELIMRLCAERKISTPKLNMSAEQASIMIDKMINYR